MAAKKQAPKTKLAPKAAAAPPAKAKAPAPRKTWRKPAEAAQPAAKAKFSKGPVTVQPTAVQTAVVTAVGAVAPKGKPLTAMDERFVLEYIGDLNATQAYVRSHPGVSYNTARTEGSKLLANPDIAAAIQKAKDERAARTGITADRALKEVWGIFTADARELVEYRVGSCRYCWGKDFGHHRTARELERDREKHAHKLLKGEVEGEFDEAGGAGYNPNREPNPDCPDCFGDGAGRPVFKDTRNLSPAAVSLYAGVKVTKEGLEIKTHGKLDAGEKMLKHLGLYEVDNKQKVDPLRELLEGLGGKSAFPVVKDVPSE